MSGATKKESNDEAYEEHVRSASMSELRNAVDALVLKANHLSDTVKDAHLRATPDEHALVFELVEKRLDTVERVLATAREKLQVVKDRLPK